VCVCVCVCVCMFDAGKQLRNNAPSKREWIEMN